MDKPGDNININLIKDESIKSLLKEKDKLERDILDKKLRSNNNNNNNNNTNTNNIHLQSVDKTLSLSSKDQHKIASEIRKMSRMSYLKNRANQQLDGFHRRGEDEKKIFNGVRGTEEEIKGSQINQKIYDGAKNKITETNINESKYNGPSNFDEDENGFTNKDKKIQVGYERYKGNKGKEENEDELWENSQKKRTGITYGAKNREVEGDKYEGLLENQVKFIKSELMEGVKKAINENSHRSRRSSRSSYSSSQSGSPTQRKGNNKNINMNINIKNIDDTIKKTPYELELEKVQTQRTELPVFTYKSEILSAIRDNQVLIIQGETGSGKTTQIPQYLDEIGYTKNNKKIAVTQPRRVAAMSVASRVAFEKNCKIGHEVGYSIRFEDCTSSLTRIKYMTDGVFLRELLTEPSLSSYSVVIIDEAHERTGYTDVIFGGIKDLAKYRKDIKIIISSATGESEKFKEYFENAPVLKIPGRRYPVDIYYTKEPESDYIEASVVTALQIHVTQPTGGDILIFLTGQEEIETAREMIYNRTKGLKGKIPNFVVLPIYSALPSEDQAKIFGPPTENERKIIIATNIAETSITINGIVYVIDCGFSKQMSFNPRTGLETGAVTPISKASAKQRAGRAGRVGPGKCFRLYTAWSYQNEGDTENIPEIQRTNLSSVVLLLKSLGIDDGLHFDFIDPPSSEILIRALEQLYALGAGNNDGDLTKLGRKMAEFPGDPCLSKAIISSVNYKCLDQMITISSMLSVGSNIFYRSRDNSATSDKCRQNFFTFGGDHFTGGSVYNEWKETDYSGVWCKDNFIHFKSMKKARNIKEQLVSLCERVEIDVENEGGSLNDAESSVNIRKAITSGFFYNCAKLSKDGVYKTIKNPHTIHIHPSSSLFKEMPKWGIYHELVYTTKEFMREIVEIQPEWLVEVAGHYYKNLENEIKEGKKTKNMGSSTINY